MTNAASILHRRLSCSPLWKDRPPRIHILSDIHLNTAPYEIPANVEFDILVAAGDIGPLEMAVPWLAAVGRPVVYVLGNHEYWGRDISRAAEEARQLTEGTDIHVLEQDSVIIEGVRFLGATLWTDFGNWNEILVRTAFEHVHDYRYISTAPWYRQADRAATLRRVATLAQLPMVIEGGEERFSPTIAYSIHHDTLSWLEAELSKPSSGPTVVVTHHAPTMECLSVFGVDKRLLNPANWPRMQRHRDLVRAAAYASALDPLLARYRSEIAAWVHGHLHMHADFLVEGVRIVSNARGHAYRTEEAASPISGGDEVSSNSERDVEVYVGESRHFDRGFVVDLATGFEVPLQQTVAECIEKLDEFIDDCKKLLPYVDCEHDVPRYAVRRGFAENVRSSEVMLERVISDAVAIDMQIGTLLGKFELPPNLPNLDALDADSAAAQVEETYARALTHLESWRSWCANLPFAASTELRRWCEAALLSVEHLQGRGISALVVSPGWRGAFYLGVLRAIPLVTNEQLTWDDMARLDSHLKEEGFSGFIPTWAPREEMQSAEQYRRLSRRDLQAALDEPASRTDSLRHNL